MKKEYPAIASKKNEGRYPPAEILAASRRL
jgi:hypothetical protein